ncbi:MAG: GFA family protein [Kiloniellales bacterium]|nr:GFA family protein [Kiloniellales bacterium]
MTPKYEGGCLCGAVRYSCSDEPVATVNCHCRDCQRTSGGPYIAGFVVPARAFSTTGEVAWYATTADSGRRSERAFCPICGSSLFGRPEAGGVLFVHATTLDDPSWFKPAIDIYTSSAQPWDVMDPAVTKFEKMPPMDAG